MSKKIVCLFLALAVGVSSIVLAFAEETKKESAVTVDDSYYEAVEELAANGMSNRSGNYLTDSKGMQLAIDMGMLEKDNELSLSQLSAQALIQEQREQERQAKKEAARIKAEAKKATREALMAKYDGVKICCDDTLNMRDKPDGSIIRSLDAGKVAKLKNIKDGWYKITFGDETGYVSADYCKLVHYDDYGEETHRDVLPEIVDTNGTAIGSSARRAVSAAASGDMMSYAYSYLGTPYSYGGTSYSGIDCSGFTMQVFAHCGVSVSHSVVAQYASGTHVSRDQLQPGDIVVFATGGESCGHVGLYVGGDQFIHAGCSTGVTVSSLNDSYWAPRYTGGARIVG